MFFDAIQNSSSLCREREEELKRFQQSFGLRDEDVELVREQITERYSTTISRKKIGMFMIVGLAVLLVFSQLIYQGIAQYRNCNSHLDEYRANYKDFMDTYGSARAEEIKIDCEKLGVKFGDG